MGPAKKPPKKDLRCVDCVIVRLGLGVGASTGRQVGAPELSACCQKIIMTDAGKQIDRGIRDHGPAASPLVAGVATLSASPSTMWTGTRRPERLAGSSAWTHAGAMAKTARSPGNA